MEIPQTCKGCGKCCYWAACKNIPVHDIGVLLYYGRCQYLTDENECSIYYSNRPEACILTQRGSDACIEFLNQE